MAFGMNFFRKHQGRFLLVLAVFLMVTWFVGGSIVELIAPEAGAGTMFGKKVTTREYHDARTALIVLTLGRTPADDDVWRLLTVLHEAERLGVKVTGDEITAGIRQWVTQVTGAQTQSLDDAYRTIISSRGMSDDMVRFAIEKELLAGKVMDMVAGARIPTDAAAWQEYVREGLEVKLKTLQVPAANFLGEATKPSAEQLAKYYEENQARYTVPALAAFEYAGAAKSEYGQLFAVTDEEISKYYEEHKVEDYMLPPTENPAVDSTDAAADVASTDAAMDSSAPAAEEAAYRPLSEVAGEITAKLQERKAIQAATDAKIDLDSHKDWTLKKIADDYGFKLVEVSGVSADDKDKLGPLADAKVGDRDLVTMVFGSEAKALGDLVVAEGPSGSYIVRVVSLDEARQPAIDEVKDKVESDYVRAEAEKLAVQSAGTVLEGLKSEGWDKYQNDGQYIVEEMTLGPDTTLKTLLESAASARTGEFGGPVLGSSGAYVYEVLQRKEPDAQNFERYKGFLKSIYAMREKQEFLRGWQEALMEKANIQKAQSDGIVPEPAPAPLDSGLY